MSLHSVSQKMMISFIRTLCTATIALTPLAASAHIGVGDAHGLVHGFVHPLSGVDHVLAMIAVGVFAARMGGRALWLVPLTFVCVMALAAIAGAAGIDVPFVEVGIGLSVAVLGLAVALQVNVPLSLATSLVAFFAIFHGHVHGTEVSQSVAGISYGIGFMLPPRCFTRRALVWALRLGIQAGFAVAGSWRSVVPRSRSPGSRFSFHSQSNCPRRRTGKPLRVSGRYTFRCPE